MLRKAQNRAKTRRMLFFLPLLIPKAAALHFGTFAADEMTSLLRKHAQRECKRHVAPTRPILDALEGIKLLEDDCTAFGMAAMSTEPYHTTTHLFLCTKQDGVIRLEKCYWGVGSTSNIYAIELLLSWCALTFPNESFVAGERLSALEQFAFTTSDDHV